MATKTTYTCDFCKFTSEDSSFIRSIGVYVSPDRRFYTMSLPASDCVMQSDICQACIRKRYDNIYQANQELLKAKAAAQAAAEVRAASETHEAKLMRIFEELIQDCVSNARDNS